MAAEDYAFRHRTHIWYLACIPIFFLIMIGGAKLGAFENRTSLECILNAFAEQQALFHEINGRYAATFDELNTADCPRDTSVSLFMSVTKTGFTITGYIRFESPAPEQVASINQNFEVVHYDYREFREQGALVWIPNNCTGGFSTR